MPRIEIDDKMLDSIRALVDYLYEEEATDYETSYFPGECNVDSSVLEAAALSDPEDNPHIFVHVVRVQKFLEELKTPKCNCYDVRECPIHGRGGPGD